MNELQKKNTECWHITVEGKVQGVGFRAYVQLWGLKLGLKGLARNMMDGRVEVLAEGTADKLEELLRICKKGPRMSEVVRTTKNKAELSKELKGFRIVY